MNPKDKKEKSLEDGRGSDVVPTRPQIQKTLTGKRLKNENDGVIYSDPFGAYISTSTGATESEKIIAIIGDQKYTLPIPTREAGIAIGKHLLRED